MAWSQCPQGTAYPDGCAGSPSGTPQFPNLLDVHKVIYLNIIPGSGYTNGTYTWTTSGGGGSGATGTITVSGGQLGGARGILYTISSEGSSYTSRPAIAVPAGAGAGTGGSITAMVHQKRPPWNAPGVDYYVGPPSGTSYLDPTNPSNLPSGAAFAGTTVTVTGCNVTLSNLDFTLHNTNITINVTSTPCVTTLDTIKMLANSNNTLQQITISGGNKSSVVILRSDLNGNAPLGSGGSGMALDGEIIDNSTVGANVTIEYSWCHDYDAKCIQISGSSLGTRVFTEKYNLFSDIDMCESGCAHGENEYTYNPPGEVIQFAVNYNMYFVPFLPKGNTATSQAAVQADNLTINGTGFDHNSIFAPGPGGTCTTSNSNAYEGAANVFDGAQNDPGAAAINNVTFAYNYLDGSGVFFNWYHGALSGGATKSGLVWENNIDAGAGGLCNQNSLSPPTTPVATPAAGSYTSTQTVSLSNPSGAPVLCWNTTTSPVTDAATGCKNGTVYSGPIPVSSSETLYYVAGGTGLDDSIQASSAYVITSATNGADHFSILQ